MKKLISIFMALMFVLISTIAFSYEMKPEEIKPSDYQKVLNKHKNFLDEEQAKLATDLFFDVFDFIIKSDFNKLLDNPSSIPEYINESMDVAINNGLTNLQHADLIVQTDGKKFIVIVIDYQYKDGQHVGQQIVKPNNSKQKTFNKNNPEITL